MRAYGFKWDLMGPYKSLCVRIGAYEFLYLLRRPYGSLWVFVGLYASLCVFMDSYRSVRVLIL